MLREYVRTSPVVEPNRNGTRALLEYLDEVRRYVNALEARIETLETQSADYESRITALEP